ncbi:MAG: PH domain-containing protein [Mycobacteriales bacterium]
MSVQVQPRRLTAVCRALAALVVVVFAVLAVLLPRGASGGQEFGVADQLSFFGIGLLLAAGLLAFTRARVRADGRGIWVRNVLGDRFFPWEVVVGVHLPESASWAQLELHDDETVALLAIQTNDGDTAVDAVLSLRRLLQSARDTGS